MGQGWCSVNVVPFQLLQLKLLWCRQYFRPENEVPLRTTISSTTPRKLILISMFSLRWHMASPICSLFEPLFQVKLSSHHRAFPDPDARSCAHLPILGPRQVLITINDPVHVVAGVGVVRDHSHGPDGCTTWKQSNKTSLDVWMDHQRPRCSHM